jgi:hypothetical protein
MAVDHYACGCTVIYTIQKWLLMQKNWSIMWELLPTIEVVANSTIVVVVVSQLATTPCAVVKKITTNHILWSLYF